MSKNDTIPCPEYKCRKRHQVMRKYGPPHDHIQQYKCGRCGRIKNKRVHCWFGMHRYKTRVARRKNRPTIIRCTKCGEPKRLNYTNL